MTAAALGVDDAAEPGGIRQRSYHAFLQRLAESPVARDWWSAVILIAGSKAQAELYREQIRYRSERGYLPRNVSCLELAPSLCFISPRLRPREFCFDHIGNARSTAKLSPQIHR
jgi:hypothetical protein